MLKFIQLTNGMSARYVVSGKTQKYRSGFMKESTKSINSSAASAQRNLEVKIHWQLMRGSTLEKSPSNVQYVLLVFLQRRVTCGTQGKFIKLRDQEGGKLNMSRRKSLALVTLTCSPSERKDIVPRGIAFSRSLLQLGFSLVHALKYKSWYILGITALLMSQVKRRPFYTYICSGFCPLQLQSVLEDNVDLSKYLTPPLHMKGEILTSGRLFVAVLKLRLLNGRSNE